MKAPDETPATETCDGVDRERAEPLRGRGVSLSERERERERRAAADRSILPDLAGSLRG